MFGCPSRRSSHSIFRMSCSRPRTLCVNLGSANDSPKVRAASSNSIFDIDMWRTSSRGFVLHSIGGDVDNRHEVVWQNSLLISLLDRSRVLLTLLTAGMTCCREQISPKVWWRNFLHCIPSVCLRSHLLQLSPNATSLNQLQGE